MPQGRPGAETVSSFPRSAWERTSWTLRVRRSGTNIGTTRQGFSRTQSVEDVRDDAERRHEIGDEMGEDTRAEAIFLSANTVLPAAGLVNRASLPYT